MCSERLKISSLQSVSYWYPVQISALFSQALLKWARLPGNKTLEKQPILFLGHTSVGSKLQGCTDSREGPHVMPQSSNIVSGWTHRSVSAEPQSSAKPPALDCRGTCESDMGEDWAVSCSHQKIPRAPGRAWCRSWNHIIVWVGRDL